MSPSAEPIRPRPFRIADGMVLIAALFVAAAWDRGRVLGAIGFHFPSSFSFSALAFEAAQVVLLWLPFLVVGSLTAFALRLQQPRPDLRRLLQQPGAVACALATLAIVPTGSTVLSTHFFSGRPLAYAWARTVDDLKLENFTVLAVLVGLAVMVAWIVMKAQGQWRPEASWIDRVGRLLGCGWILMIFGGMIQLILGLVRLT
jgi:hypothetical protein